MPGVPWIQVRLAQGLTSLNHPGRAIPILRRVPEDWAGRDAAITPLLVHTLCWAYHAKGDYAAELAAARAAQALLCLDRPGETLPIYQELAAEAPDRVPF